MSAVLSPQLAKRRPVVHLADGRTGVLVYWPPAKDAAQRSPRVVIEGVARSLPVPAGQIVAVGPVLRPSRRSRVASPGRPVPVGVPAVALPGRDSLATCPCGRPCTGAACSACEHQIAQGSGEVLTTGLGSEPAPAESPTGGEVHAHPPTAGRPLRAAGASTREGEGADGESGEAVGPDAGAPADGDSTPAAPLLPVASASPFHGTGATGGDEGER